MQASEIRFLRKIKGVTTFDKLCNIAIRESFNIESLLLRIERSQLRWFGHASKMPQERLPKQTLNAKVNGKKLIVQDGLIISRILVGTVWDVIQAKCCLSCWTEKCGGLIWSCFSATLKEKRMKKEENIGNLRQSKFTKSYIIAC